MNKLKPFAIVVSLFVVIGVGLVVLNQTGGQSDKGKVKTAVSSFVTDWQNANFGDACKIYQANQCVPRMVAARYAFYLGQQAGPPQSMKITKVSVDKDTSKVLVSLFYPKVGHVLFEVDLNKTQAGWKIINIRSASVVDQLLDTVYNA